MISAFLVATASFALATPATAADFPRNFLWGTASSGFQSEAGGSPANVDKRSDWYAFTSDPDLIAEDVVSGDDIADGAKAAWNWAGDRLSDIGDGAKSLVEDAGSVLSSGAKKLGGLFS